MNQNNSAETDCSETELSRRSVLSAGLSIPMCSAVTGNVGAMGAQSTATQTPETIWDIDTPINTHPLVQDGIVFSISVDGIVRANSAETGSNIWRQTLGSSPYHSSIGISENTLLAGGDDGQLLAVEYRSGERQWKRTLSGGVLAIAAAGDNTIVTSQGAVQSIRTSDGLVNWRTEIDIYNNEIIRNNAYWSNPFSGTPVVRGNAVFVRTKKGVAALRLSDGEIIWQATDPGDLSSAGHGLELAIVGDRLFFVSTVLTTVDIETGDILRVTEFPDATREVAGAEHGLVGPVTNGELVFTGSNKVYAVNAVTGETVWEGGGVPYPWHGLAYDKQGGNLYISAVTDEGETLSLICLEDNTGVEKWRLPVGEMGGTYSYESFISRAIATENAVFVAVRGRDSTLSAIRTQEISIDTDTTNNSSTVAEQTENSNTTDSDGNRQTVSAEDSESEQDAEYRGLVSNNPNMDIGNQFGDMYFLTLLSTALSLIVMIGRTFQRGGNE